VVVASRYTLRPPVPAVAGRSTHQIQVETPRVASSKAGRTAQSIAVTRHRQPFCPLDPGPFIARSQSNDIQAIRSGTERDVRISVEPVHPPAPERRIFAILQSNSRILRTVRRIHDPDSHHIAAGSTRAADIGDGFSCSQPAYRAPTSTHTSLRRQSDHAPRQADRVRSCRADFLRSINATHFVHSLERTGQYHRCTAADDPRGLPSTRGGVINDARKVKAAVGLR